MAKPTADEMKNRVEDALGNSPYNHKEGWFFPSDLVPHSSSFKYCCKRLYELGILERRGDSTNRWGYSYCFTKEEQK